MLSSCIGKHTSDVQKATVLENNTPILKSIGDTMSVDRNASSILWKGTKMHGVGKHEGTIEIKKGYFMTADNQLVGGRFIIDMATITVTDIPEHEPVPLKNLTDHLKGVDFFDVGHFPTARFEITTIKNKVSDSLKVSGNLTIKGITKTITFDALYTDAIFSTTFTINRFQWNIAYEGNLINKTLVDKDIELTIRLKTE